MQVELQLGRGEPGHILTSRLFASSRGEICSNYSGRLMNNAICLGVLPYSVLAWNMTAIMKIAAQLQATGETIVGEDRTRISSLMYRALCATERIGRITSREIRYHYLSRECVAL